MFLEKMQHLYLSAIRRNVKHEEKTKQTLQTMTQILVVSYVIYNHARKVDPFGIIGSWYDIGSLQYPTKLSIVVPSLNKNWILTKGKKTSALTSSNNKTQKVYAFMKVHAC